MDSLLDALQEGRLIELPDNDKQDSLQLLAHIIEAIPSVPTDTDVAGLVLKREETYNTSLGKGFAVSWVLFASALSFVSTMSFPRTSVFAPGPCSGPFCCEVQPKTRMNTSTAASNQFFMPTISSQSFL